MRGMSLGEQFVAALVRGADTSEFIRLTGVDKFLKAHEREAYETVKTHVRKHGVLPKVSTAEDEYSLKVGEVDEPASFYYEKLRARHVRIQLIKSWEVANAELKSDPIQALELFQGACFSLGLTASPSRIMTLQDAADVIIPRYAAKQRGEGGGITLGWETFDRMSGGVGGGDLISFVGRPSQGKTQMLIWAALHVNRVLHRPVLFVSMEMQPELILERCVAIYTKTPIAEIRQTSGRGMITPVYKRFKKDLEALRDDQVPFHIIDGNLGSTVPDIYMMARQLRPAALFIDGGYLVRHVNDRLQSNQRIAANCNMMKQMLATDLNIPTIVTWQVNREGAKSKRKKGEGQILGMEHIAGSDAISQDSSVICGLMEEETIEAILFKLVQVMKGRHGEQGEWKMAWDWEAMNFSDYEPPKVEQYHITEAGPIKIRRTKTDEKDQD